MKNTSRDGVFQTGWRNGLLCLLLAGLTVLTSQVYTFLNHGPAVLFLKTPLDELLPVVPFFVIPYLSLAPLLILTLLVFLLSRTRLFQVFCLALIATWLVSYGFYAFLQTEVIRPVLTGSGTFTSWINWVYSVDQPFNDFPSLHTSLSILMAVYWLRFKRRIGIVAVIWTVLIVASTLLVKQHYLADLVAGGLLAWGVAWYTRRFPGQEKRSIPPSPLKTNPFSNK
jgi:membrane-associated phospholipid phosphatase